MRTPFFWHRPNPLAYLLLPLAWLYQLGYRMQRAFITPRMSPIPLICVGNLVAGGGGKTPVATLLGELCKDADIHACFLTRGYGGSVHSPLRVQKNMAPTEVGDEALILAKTLPTFVSRCRMQGVALAAKEGFELVIMDDGFQNPSIRPHLSLVVVDGAYGFGNGLTLPAGPLREPVAYGLKRADAVALVMRFGQQALPNLPEAMLSIALDFSKMEVLKGKKYVAFAGIARPPQFFGALIQHGLEVVETRAFADHHDFSALELAQLREAAAAQGATLITTAKDAVRLPPEIRSEVVVAELFHRLTHGKPWLAEQLSKLLARPISLA